jgi:hypothetical protein
VKSDLEKMNKRRELMEDGRRDIIFYTFGSENLEESNHPLRDTETQKKQEKPKEK